MGNPYTSVTVTNYNANPPPDDGTQVPANRVAWSTQKEKLGDPLKTAIELMNTNVAAAFAKVLGGSGLTSTAVNYTVLTGDQGKLVRATASGITLTTPDATSVDDPFVFGVLNNSSGDITVDGSGAQTIDGVASIIVPAGRGTTIYTDGTNWFTDGQNFALTKVTPQGYLTVVTATPMPASDTTSTNVYYTPDQGDLLPTSDGSLITVRQFTELTLALVSNHLASTLYDVFAFIDSGTLRIGTGPAWNTSTAGSGARGTGAGTTELERWNGLFVNKVSMTARNGSTTYSVAARAGVYLGSIFIDGTAGNVTCSMAVGSAPKWGVYNAYNQRRILLRQRDNTANWTYATATWRASNGSASNKLTVFKGLPDESIPLTFSQKIENTVNAGNTNVQRIGIGVNSTSSPSGQLGTNDYTNSGAGQQFLASPTVSARHQLNPGIGINDITPLEFGSTSGTQTFYGTESFMRLEADWMG